MKRINSKDKLLLEREIKECFPQYSYTSAPINSQGQNSYSYNYILTKDGDKYLLKIILLDKVVREVNEEQVKAEISVYASISTPGTVPLLKHQITKKHAFLLFPFLEGKTLEEEMRERNERKEKFTEEEIKDIAISLVLTISELFRKGKVVHQDIKPSNIFLSQAGGVKLLDFGAVRYNKSPFKGIGRSNYSYASPEQIRTGRPSSIEAERSVVDDRSDVFSVGAVLYQLTAGEHPFSAKYPADKILEGKAVPPLTREDISKELKEIIMAMLAYKSSHRLHASRALASLQEGKLNVPAFDKGKFYYCATNGLSRYLELNEKNSNLFDGIIVEASQVPEKQKGKINLQLASKTLIVDPQTYLFQKPAASSKKFSKVPYHSFSRGLGDGEAFVNSFIDNPDRTQSFVEKVLQFQIDAGASVLIPPFLYIEDFTDTAWDVDQILTEASLEVIRKNAWPHPVIKGIALQQGVLTSSSKESLMDYLTSLESVAGFFTLLDSGHAEVIIDDPWLKSAKDLFRELLSTGKSVLWSRADISGLVLAHPSLSLAMGETLSARKFDIDSERQSGGNQSPFMYLPGIFARAKWKAGIEALKNYEEFQTLMCTDSCCEGVDFANLGTRNIRDLALHMVCQFGAQFRLYSAAGGARKAMDDIKSARKHYKVLKESGNFLITEALRKKDIKPSTSSFLDNWLNALHGR